MKVILRIGHRGAKGYALENTLSSFQKALDLGVDMVEMDLRLTKDDQIVVFHDRNLKRMCGIKGYVDRRSLAELRILRINGKEKIPTFGEVLDLVGGKINLDIEIKVPGFEKEVVQELKSRNLFESVVISSFNKNILLNVKELTPNLKTFLIYKMRILRLRHFVKKYKFNGIVPYHRVLTKGLIKKAKDLGLEVFVWTANSKKAIEKAKKYGVDGIISDFPDRV